MDSTFANIFRRNSAVKIGLEGPFTYGHDYTFIEIPWSGELFDTTQEVVVTTAKKGQRLKVIPATNLFNRGFKEKCFIVVNPLLQEVADVSYMPLLETAADDKINIMARFFKDSDLTNLSWLVRLYMFS